MFFSSRARFYCLAPGSRPIIEAMKTSPRRLIFFLTLTLGVLPSCARRTPAPRGAVVKPGWKESGVASWYGVPYHGRRAADGSIYDMEKMTAAHRTLEFGTKVRVERLDNHRRVEVIITDRGPFIDGRIIDLSRAAARELELLGPGITKVRITVLSVPARRRQSGLPQAREGILISAGQVVVVVAATPLAE
jgi:hypothetical protein